MDRAVEALGTLLAPQQADLRGDFQRRHRRAVRNSRIEARREAPGLIVRHSTCDRSRLERGTFECLRQASHQDLTLVICETRLEVACGFTSPTPRSRQLLRIV